MKFTFATHAKKRKEKCFLSAAFYYRFHRFSISHKKCFSSHEKEKNDTYKDNKFSLFVGCVREMITNTTVHDVEMRRKLRRFSSFFHIFILRKLKHETFWSKRKEKWKKFFL